MTSALPLLVDRYLVDNGAGWRLSLTRTRSSAAAGRPVLIVPGYGMNSYIFGFHPNGPSLVETLAGRGLEVWTADLRNQGKSIRAGGTNRYGMADLAVEDIGAAVKHVLASTSTGASTLDLIGCSLGAALSFAHVACTPDAPVHAIVAMAGLVSWKRAHPMVRLAFGSPRVAGLLRIKNTRRIARVALPVLARVAPSLLSVYLNHRSTDLSQTSRMVQTVEDPHPIINREIAEWIRRGDLIVRGVNVSQKLAELRHPFFCVVASDDGIVMPETARHTYEAIGSERKALLEVGGDPQSPIAHADLFVCRGAQERIFIPVADFLQAA